LLLHARRFDDITVDFQSFLITCSGMTRPSKEANALDNAIQPFKKTPRCSLFRSFIFAVGSPFASISAITLWKTQFLGSDQQIVLQI